MLKIKDNVDLQELEKFGFVANYQPQEDDNGNETQVVNNYTYYLPNDEYETYYFNNDGIHKETRHGSSHITIYCSHRKIFKNNLRFETIMDDILYDLIKAGLVEKVSDGNE